MGFIPPAMTKNCFCSKSSFNLVVMRLRSAMMTLLQMCRCGHAEASRCTAQATIRQILPTRMSPGVRGQVSGPTHPDTTTSAPEVFPADDARLRDRRCVGWPGKSDAPVAGGAYRLRPGERAVQRFNGSHPWRCRYGCTTSPDVPYH